MINLVFDRILKSSGSQIDHFIGLLLCVDKKLNYLRK